jgi:hypothetical protein
MRRFLIFAVLILWTAPLFAWQEPPAREGRFKVTYAEVGTVYLDGGKNAGLREGMTLVIRRARTDGQFKGTVIVAKLTVVSVANTSAMCQVRAHSADILRGDVATLTQEHDALAPSAALGSQGLNQTERSSVLGPAMAKIGSENVASNRPQAAQNSTNTPMSLADVARMNRGEAPRTLPPAVQAASQPVTQVPAATQPAETQGITVTSTPMSVAEAARLQRKSAAQATLAANKPAPTPAQTSSAKVELAAPTKTENAAPVSSQPPVVAASANTAASAPAPAKPAEREKKKVEVAAAQPEKPAAPSEPKPAAAAAAGNRTQASPIVARQTPAQPAPVNPPVQVAAAAAEKPAPAIVSAPSEKRSGSPIMMAANIPPARTVPASLPSVPSKSAFNVKYVAEDAVYIDAGKNAGLQEGMELTVKKADAAIAEIAVVSVSNTSAVCEIRSKTTDISRGDIALLQQSEVDKMAQTQSMGPTRRYPQIVAFSQGDPLDEEVRESIPKPPPTEINRGRGRIGLDSTFINNKGASPSQSLQLGAVVRADITRIGGSYWNLNGYWRGRLNTFTSTSSSTTQPQSVYDLINRTYTIGFTYVNPKSRWTAGVGRLYLPWAPSLDTLDGGYMGMKLGSHTTLGVFGGTTPDPTSFDYNPDRRMAGSFVAIEAGSFDKVRFTSAEGIGVSGLEWRADRQFVFSENGFFVKRFLSIYHSAQADIQRLPTGGKVEGLNRSFATLRVQPFSRLSLDVNHNYFRDVPTFDPSLVGTGLLDKFLFQGISVGSRLELPWRISVYDNFGQSNRSGDPRKSINQLYGLTLGRLWKTGLRGDVRYSKFTSSFGAGDYRAASLSRSFREILRLEVNAGEQKFTSSIGTPTNYRLLGSTVDVNLGGHYFVEGSMNLQKSSQQTFEQWLITTGYRFDTGKRK